MGRKDKHHWDEDPARAGVERVFDLPARTSTDARRGYAYERAWRVRGARTVNGGDALRESGGDGRQAVLAIDEYPREFRARLRHRARVEEPRAGEPDAEGGLVCFEGAQEDVGGHCECTRRESMRESRVSPVTNNPSVKRANFSTRCRRASRFVEGLKASRKRYSMYIHKHHEEIQGADTISSESILTGLVIKLA